MKNKIDKEIKQKLKRIGMIIKKMKCKKCDGTGIELNKGEWAESTLLLLL